MKFIKPQKIIPIFVSVLIFTIYLIIFFFFYERKAEQKIIENDLKDIVQDLSKDLETIVVSKRELSNIIKDIKEPDYINEDILVENKNRKLYRISISILLGIILIGLILILFYKDKFQINFKDLIITNILLLIFVGLSEAWFFKNIAGKFISVDPNVVKLQIIENIKKL